MTKAEDFKRDVIALKKKLLHTLRGYMLEIEGQVDDEELGLLTIDYDDAEYAIDYVIDHILAAATGEEAED